MDFDDGNESSEYARANTAESDGSGSSKHSSRRLEFDDEPGSSKHSSEGSENSRHSRRLLEHDVETGSSKHSDICEELINGSGRIESIHFEINAEDTKGSENDDNFVIHPEVIDGSESSKRSEVIEEEIDRNEEDVSTTKLRLSSSSSSSSSSEDQVQDKHHVSGKSSSKSEECQNGSASPTLTPQTSSVTHESTLTQSPPIQVMDRQGEFDPQRIPSSVFERSKSTTTPMDWSVASNDSLFSIQVGNNSFSRDQILSLKSGELFKSGEFIAFSPSRVASSVDTDKKSAESDKMEATSVAEAAVKDKAGVSAEGPTGEKPTHPVVSWNSSKISSHSVDSATSKHSFAFPMGKKKKKQQKQESACPSCYCSNCGCAFCYCTWPSCCCSNCSRAFCYGWNGSIKRCLSDAKGNSKKEKPEKQQQQEQHSASEVPSKSACCKCCCWTLSCRCRWRWHWHWHWCCGRKCCPRKCC